jgi:hypothetical protein
MVKLINETERKERKGKERESKLTVRVHEVWVLDSLEHLVHVRLQHLLRHLPPRDVRLLCRPTQRHLPTSPPSPREQVKNSNV